MILRDLYKKGLNWVDQIPNEDRTRWEAWLGELLYLNYDSLALIVVWNRIILVMLVKPVTHLLQRLSARLWCRDLPAHHERYWRHSLFLSNCHVPGNAAKSVSIPRLELSAAVVATRLNQMIKHELDVATDESYFWTDSTWVLSYIFNKDKRFQTFVANTGSWPFMRDLN